MTKAFITVVSLALFSVLGGCQGDVAANHATDKPAPAGASAGQATTAPAARLGEGTTPQASNPVVLIETSEGNIKVELWPDKAPITVKNFLQYVNEGFYNGTIFHRIINNFMIQGGGRSVDGSDKTTRAPIKNEARADVGNATGTIAMARTGVVDSATAQFFINVVDNDPLNHRDDSLQGYGYAVFGKVIEGMDVVNKIKSVPTGPGDVPIKPVIINKVTVVPAGK